MPPTLAVTLGAAKAAVGESEATLTSAATLGVVKAAAEAPAAAAAAVGGVEAVHVVAGWRRRAAVRQMRLHRGFRREGVTPASVFRGSYHGGRAAVGGVEGPQAFYRRRSATPLLWKLRVGTQAPFPL